MPRTSAIVTLLVLVVCNAQPWSTLPTSPAIEGFDGSRAFEHVRYLVELGPRPSDSDGIRRAQSYIVGQLKSFGCQVTEHDFHASTPIGDLPMKNILVEIPGTGTGLAISAKRYVVYKRRKSAFEIIKASEHGLGIVYVPDERKRYTPI